MIAFEDFSFRYQGSDHQALRQITFQIEEGEFVLLSGPSGCGKSTIALAAAGFLFSHYAGEFSGLVSVNGVSAAKIPIYEIADLVGLVQQNPESQFCTLTVEDEIVFGLENKKYPRKQIQEQLDWSLKAVGGEALRDRTLSTLSGGEKQKVALAAILATRPRLIIFDEPTSNLDPPATQEIFETILRLQKEIGLSMLVIEHKLDFLNRINPRLIFMEEGRIVDRNSRQLYSGLGELTRPLYNGSPTPPPLIEGEDLSVGYGEKEILHRINFQIRPGELISLMGDNGSGKSTLLLSLLGLIERNQGRLNLFDKELGKTQTSSLGREVGLVFQNPDHQLFADSVWEEAVFGPINYHLPEDSFQNQTRILLERAGLSGREDDHPYQLSYGEKRRLNLISILSYQPSVLLLDEILIGQDQENAHFLLQQLVEFVEAGGSVVMVNHNPDYYPQVATRLLFLCEGKLTVDAPIDEGMAALEQMGKMAYLPGGGL